MNRSREEFEIFCNAATLGDRETVEQLLRQNPKLAQAADESGFTALHALMEQDLPEMAEQLIRHGADVHARNDMRMTPLHIAQWASLVEVLVRHGADVNAVAEEGWTPLHRQAQEGEDTGSVEVMGALLKAGANPNLRDEGGDTPMSLAKQRSEKKKVTLLRAYRAK